MKELGRNGRQRADRKFSILGTRPEFLNARIRGASPKSGIQVCGPLTKQMVADISNHLADLDRLLLNELRTIARFGAEVLQLQELRLSKDRPEAIIQVVQPFSDSIFIHKGTNPSTGLLFEVHGFLHDLIGHGAVAFGAIKALLNLGI